MVRLMSHGSIGRGTKISTSKSIDGRVTLITLIFNQKKTIAIIRDVDDEGFSFYFYIYTEKYPKYKIICDSLPKSGAHFINFTFGLKDPNARAYKHPLR